MTFENATSPVVGIERGRQATAALRHLHVRGLLQIRARATFRPISDDQLAPIFPCTACGDGGLRVVGCVRRRPNWQRVHACDTCGALQCYDISEPPLI